MGLWQTIKLAVAAIRSNKMRSFLTMLGVIIGVASVIVLVSIGEGSSKSVTDKIQSMGSNLISINIRSNYTSKTLDYAEVMNWENKTGVKAVCPVVSGSVTVKHGSDKYDTTLEGVNDEYQDVRNHKLAQGRFIIPTDLSFRQKVVVLGSDVVSELFPNSNPIGETVKIDGQNFLVVGVMAEKGSETMGSYDDKVIVPLTTGQRIVGSTDISSVYVQADSSDTVDLVVAELENILYKKTGDTDAYRVFNQEDMLSTVSEVSGTMTAMLGGIAGISLVVGGIGIMNIMLVSVTERTREIGIRKAIGAKRKDILWQFLIESLVVSCAGGIMGILIGMGGSKLVSSLLSMETATSVSVMALAFSFSVMIGIIFGLYPANKASKLNPIEALRFE